MRKAAVIGSGFGGIAAAIRLQAAGIQTTIFEKKDKPGGRAYVFNDHGFTFDAGPTVITAPEALEELFTLAGKAMADYVTLLPVSPFYQLCWENGYRFDYSNDERTLLQQIRDKSPEDVLGYQNFLKYSRDVFQEGYEKLVHVPFLSWWDMIRAAPQLVRLKAYRSVYSTVSHYIRDKELREAFSFHSLLVGGNPFSTSSIYTLIHYLERKWGVYFAKGGTGELVRGLLRLFQELGGELRLDSPVREIVTDGRKVCGIVDRRGERRSFDIVVSNADVVHTYADLLAREGKVRATEKKIRGMSYSMSLFLIYFGVKKTYPNVAHHSVLFGQRYRELLADIFDRGILADDFSLYLHAPTRTDPSMAPPGCESFYVLSPVPHLGKWSDDWATRGPVYAKKILNYLEKYYLPDLNKNIVTQRIFTPEDFKTEYNSHLGSAFSVEPTLTQSAYFRPHNRDENIAGLYFVGAGTHPGAGIPGVINSGKATAGLVIEDYRESSARAGNFEYQPA